jgi:biopolymer transport protein ExbB
MQHGTCAQRFGRTMSPRRGRRYAIALMAIALLVAVPLMARGQGTGQGTVQANPAASGAAAAPAAPGVPAATPGEPAQPGASPGAAAAPNVPPASNPAPSVTAAAPTLALPGGHMVSGADLPEDLSPWAMFENSDLVVKAVIIGLAFASLVTWTVWLAKTLELRTARSEVRRDLHLLNNSVTLAQAHDQLRDGETPVSQLMRAAGQEIRLSANLRADGLKERIALQLERIEMAVSRKISRGTGVLATIGSTAPFVGLFGTVWGIMNSFIGISNAHTTNLAVVAPGIAQALLATAFGLVAAIPAVMIYNLLARQTAHYRAYLGDASAQVMRLVSRDLDRAKLPMTQAAE